MFSSEKNMFAKPAQEENEEEDKSEEGSKSPPHYAKESDKVELKGKV